MKKMVIVAGCWFLVAGSRAQSVNQKLLKAYNQFEADSQLKHAISSLYVIDAKTGQVVFGKNSQVGLAPASTQKIITSVTAFELLGKDFRYKTEFVRTIDAEPPLFEELTIRGYGDPTLGSWRYGSTKPEPIFSKVLEELKKKGITKINGPVTAYNNFFESVHLPTGWIWEDIGNYYGAGATDINWKENQFDIWMKPGKKVNDSVIIFRTDPARSYEVKFTNNVRTGDKNSGDNAYVYFDLTGGPLIVKGTIPCCVDSFKISASLPVPSSDAASDLGSFLKKQKFPVQNLSMVSFSKDLVKRNSFPVYTHYSPSLDSIIYWFLKKSINLYGEALIKTFAYEKQGFGSTDSGVAIVKKFWKDKGMDEDELNIYDGSGLSPLNRVTTHAQVEVLKYAKTKDWFPLFYNSLPEYNGMQMKSGTISDVKGFCGYHKSKDGKEYIFSFLVNNYSGKSSALVGKMYRVLDELK